MYYILQRYYEKGCVYCSAALFVMLEIGIKQILHIFLMQAKVYAFNGDFHVPRIFWPPEFAKNG